NYSNAHEWYSNLLAAVGRFDEAIEASSRSIELNPLSARGRVMNGWLLYQTRHFRRATAEAEKAVEIEKGFAQGYLHLGNALEKAFDDRNEWLIWLGTEAKFDSLREDARYFDLLERMNNPILKQQRAESEVSASEMTIAVLPLKTLRTGKTGNTEEDFLGIGL